MGGTLNTNRWQNNYKEVYTYLTEHNCTVNDVPDDAVFSNGKHLKRWLFEMQKAIAGRSRYHLNSEQITLLNAIGIQTLMSVTDRDWFLHFDELIRFYSEHHHFKIPADYLCSDGKKLRGWVRLQRYRYRDGELPQKYIEAFQKHNLMEALESPLDTAMRHVEEYYREHSDIDFDTAYVCPDGYNLGTWLRTFRDKVAKQRNKKQFPQDIIDRLNEMGMIWNKTEHIWQQTYNELKNYIEIHGKKSLPSELKTISGTSMKTWVKNTQRAYQEGRLSEDKMTLLGEIGLHEITFEEPQRIYKSTDTANTADKTKASRKKPVKNGTKSKAKSKAKKPVSTGRKEIRRKQWYENVELCRQFITEHGTTFPPEMRSVNGESLKNWVNLNRSKHRRGVLPPERAAALESIGIMEIRFRKPPEQRKKRTGRPHKKSHSKLPAEKRRMHPVSLRVSEDEYQELRLAAAKEGYEHLSDYIRAVLLSDVNSKETDDNFTK